MSDEKPNKPLIQDFPVDLDNDKHLFTPPLDVQNTDTNSLLYLLTKKTFTPSIPLNPVQKGTVCAVLNIKDDFEYNSSVELETFFRKDKDPKR